MAGLSSVCVSCGVGGCGRAQLMEDEEENGSSAVVEEVKADGSHPSSYSHSLGWSYGEAGNEAKSSLFFSLGR